MRIAIRSTLIGCALLFGAGCGSSRSGTGATGSGSTSSGVRVTGGNSSGTGTTTSRTSSSSSGTTLGQLNGSNSTGGGSPTASSTGGGSPTASSSGGLLNTSSSSSGGRFNTSSSSSGGRGSTASSTTGGTTTGGTTTGGTTTGAAGACLSPPADPQDIDNGDLGANCTAYGDGGGTGCQAGEYCVSSDGNPGPGACYALGCDATQQTGCPGTAYCLDDGQGNTACIPLCFPSSGANACNGDEVCAMLSPNPDDLSECVSRCTQDSDCNDPSASPATANVCDLTSGQCKCTRDADCGTGGTCDVDTGICYAACAGDADCSGNGCCETVSGVSFCDPYGIEDGGSGTTSGSGGSTGSTSSGSTGGSTTGGGGTPTAGFFFSEYYEGLSNNKAVELYNGTASAVDLSQYQIRVYYNGHYALDAGAPDGVWAFLDAGGVSQLSPGATLLICNSRFDAGAAQPPCDVLTGGQASPVNFTGDDTLLLTQSDGTVVDSIGDGTDPGTAWGTGTDSTNHNDLRRACGSPLRTDVAAPFDPAAAGWDGFGVDALGDLGSYDCANQ